MRFQAILEVLVGALVLSGCASTTYFSEEYSKVYVTKKDLFVAIDCRMFVDNFSILFGESLVSCFNGRSEGATERIRIPAGVSVRVKKLVHTPITVALLETQDENGRSITDYFSYWPTYKD